MFNIKSQKSVDLLDINRIKNKISSACDFKEIYDSNNLNNDRHN